MFKPNALIMYLLTIIKLDFQSIVPLENIYMY